MFDRKMELDGVLSKGEEQKLEKYIEDLKRNFRAECHLHRIHTLIQDVCINLCISNFPVISLN